MTSLTLSFALRSATNFDLFKKYLQPIHSYVYSVFLVQQFLKYLKLSHSYLYCMYWKTPQGTIECSKDEGRSLSYYNLFFCSNNFAINSRNNMFFFLLHTSSQLPTFFHNQSLLWINGYYSREKKNRIQY